MTTTGQRKKIFPGETGYRICNRCVMDTTAEDITFDDKGICNYCRDMEERGKQYIISNSERKQQKERFIAEVKAAGKGKKYDCIVGVSGGVDSSYALLLAKREGLRPLAVHLDNGWNSELAVHNISNLVNTLGVDLHTHVIDWPENRDMQLSFIKANVLDIELLMDNAMLAVNYQQAKKYGLKHILAGTNFDTEGMLIPKTWTHPKYDVRNIRAIHRKFGSIPIKTHPLFSGFDQVWFEKVLKIRWYSFLQNFEYNKAKALEELKESVGYRPYPYKHYESVFTRFYQGYILPKKFGVDKRRVHLSSLIMSGQLAREDALKHFEHSPYPDEKVLHEDMQFVLKKFGMTQKEFDDYIAAPEVAHTAYPSERFFWAKMQKLYFALVGK